MSDRSTIEQIFTIRQIVEKTTEFRQTAFIAFVDFRAAFDSVDRKALWRILELTDLPEKYCILLKVLHHGTESCIQVNGRRSPFFQITNRGAPRICSDPRALQRHRRLHYWQKPLHFSALGSNSEIMPSQILILPKT